MALPKIQYPLNDIELDSVGKIRYRPMLAREEKLLLMAKQSANNNDIFTAIKQVVNNCVVDDEFDIDKLPIHELEFLFLNLRIQSIGKHIDQVYKDPEDNKEYKVRIDLSDIKIKKSNVEVDRNIEVAAGVWVIMRYPPASLYDNRRFIESGSLEGISEELLLASIEKVYDDEDVHNMVDVPHAEAVEFIDSIESSAYKKMMAFLSSSPHMEYVVRYVNSSGTERVKVLRTLNDFFTL